MALDHVGVFSGGGVMMAAGAVGVKEAVGVGVVRAPRWGDAGLLAAPVGLAFEDEFVSGLPVAPSR